MVATAPVTVEQAAAILGVSASTVRRRIRDGALRAEEISRPQGVVWLVHLPPATAPVTSGVSEAPSAASTVATAPTTAESMIAYTRSLLEPLVAALERSQGRVSELERENGGLAKENGALAERLAGLERVRDAAMARAAELEARLAIPPAVPGPRPDPFPRPNLPMQNAGPSRWRRWWLAVMGGGLVLMVGASCQQPTRSTVSAPHLCRAAQFSLARVEQELAPQANPVLGGTLMGTWTGVNELVTVIERLCRP